MTSVSSLMFCLPLNCSFLSLTLGFSQGFLVAESQNRFNGFHAHSTVRKPLKRFYTIPLSHTRLKPGVNESVRFSQLEIENVLVELLVILVANQFVKRRARLHLLEQRFLRARSEE